MLAFKESAVIPSARGFVHLKDQVVMWIKLGAEHFGTLEVQDIFFLINVEIVMKSEFSVYEEDWQWTWQLINS